MVVGFITDTKDIFSVACTIIGLLKAGNTIQFTDRNGRIVKSRILLIFFTANKMKNRTYFRVTVRTQ
jgi:hypothetical protein